MNDDTRLGHEDCIPCRGDVPPLGDKAIDDLLASAPGWVVGGDGIRLLTKGFRCADFRAALGFAIAIGEEAERQGHHPRLVVEWGMVTVEWWTHTIGGLHRNDFVMAARTERLWRDEWRRSGR